MEALVIAQSSYASGWTALPLARAAASKLFEGLAKHGFACTNQALLSGGNKQEIQTAIKNWFSDSSQGAHLLLFWTGHGAKKLGNYLLVCKDSEPQASISSDYAVTASTIGEYIADSKADKVLVILDTCYSGRGATEIVKVLSKYYETSVDIPGRERALAVIASASPLEKAQEAIFCNALCTALFDENVPRDKRKWSRHDQFITTDGLGVAVRSLLPPGASEIKSQTNGLGLDFIPNPLFRADLIAQIVEEHFVLAARGIDVGESGWYFAGRARLLHALVDWLNTSDHGVRIVTGPPGTGKSAVIGRLATLSDPQYRRLIIAAGAMPPEIEGTVPPDGIIDVAIHAKGKTLDDCARALAQGLGISVGSGVSVDIEGLVAAIGARDHRTTVVIDALDEAASGHRTAIATRLIAPLGHLAGVRVLVGSRRSIDGAVVPENEERHARLRAAFGMDALIDDLEDEKSTSADIADYVRRRLENSKHRGDTAEISEAAERVAARADGVFLYARIVSRTLQEMDRLDGDLPATALGAFVGDLRARFAPDEQRVDDVLAALAWGEGKGLTRRVWPLVANALAQPRRYDDEDVGWALTHAGWHIIEAGEDGQAAYRLAHQALADYYRRRFDVRTAQERIVAELTRGIEGAAWLDCDRYLWRHLADHAVQADKLGMLVRDAGFLAVAEPTRLVPALADIRTNNFADIYSRTVDRLVGLRPIDRLPLIHATAQMEAPDLAGQLEPPVATSWRCRWAHVRPSTPNRVLGRHRGMATAVAFGAINSRPIAASGGSDRTVRLWDVRTGSPFGEPFTGHTDDIVSVAMGVVDDRPVVLSGSKDKTVRVWDVASGTPLFDPLAGHTDHVTGVALGAVGDRLVVVSASRDRTIRFWDARTGRPTREPLQNPAAIISFALGRDGDHAIVVLGGADLTIRILDALTGQPRCAPLEGHKGWVTAVAIGAVDDLPIVVSGSDDKSIYIWNARTGTPIAGPLTAHDDVVYSVAFGMLKERPVAISSGWERTIRVWDARSGKPITDPFEGHANPVLSIAFGIADGLPVVISGSSDRTVRLWDVRMDEAVGKRIDSHSALVTSVVFGAIDGRTVVISANEDRTIRFQDAGTGDDIGKPLEEAGLRVAFGTVDNRPVVVAGDWSLGLWDVRTGTSIWRKADNTQVASVAFGTLDGRPVVTWGGSDGKTRLWEARTGETIFEKLTGEGNTQVAFGMVDGRAVVISGSQDKIIHVLDAQTFELVGKPLVGHSFYVTALAFGLVEGRPMLVSRSWDRTVRRWDLRTGEPFGEPLAVHAEIVGGVALGAINGRSVVASVSSDGMFSVSDALTGSPLMVLNLGTPIYHADIRTGLIAAGGQRGLLLLEIAQASTSTA